MIQISSGNINLIADQYFSDVKVTVQRRIGLYKNIFDYLSGDIQLADIENYQQNALSKYADINFLLNGAAIKNKRQYNLLTAANLHGWVGMNRTAIRKLLSYLSNEPRLRRLMLSRPEELYLLDKRLQRRFNVRPAVDNDGMTAFVKRLLDYEFHTDLAHGIALTLDVRTCPYCNRLPIRPISNAGGGKVIGPDFDHFFPQHKHPFLGLSFYNLVPSCTQCNSRLKGKKEMGLDTHVHPYLGGFGRDCVFNVKILKATGSFQDTSSIQISLKSHLDPKGKPHKRIFGGAHPHSGNNKLFQIETIYDQAHREDVCRLRLLADRYSKGQAKSLRAGFGKRLSDEEFYFFYFGNYMNERDFHRKPLSKLTNDIARQLLPRFFY